MWAPPVGFGLGTAVSSSSGVGFGVEPRQPKGFPLFSALEMASTDTIISLTGNYHAATVENPRAPPPCVRHCVSVNTCWVRVNVFSFLRQTSGYSLNSFLEVGQLVGHCSISIICGQFAWATRALCTWLHAFHWICRSIWQQSAAVFRELSKQKLINNFAKTLAPTLSHRNVTIMSSWPYLLK